MAVSLATAKAWLRVEGNTEDAVIQLSLDAAISWVEQYTDHILVKRDIVLSDGCHKVYAFPRVIKSSVGKYKVDGSLSSLSSTFYVPTDSSVTLTIGYNSDLEVPATLKTAVLKLTTYLYENRDAYPAEMPIDIQILINQFRRNIGWT